MRVLSILALGASLASAIQFSDPVENATVTRGSTFDLQWTSVDTDPSTFSVYLVNFVNWPPFYTLLDLDLETSAGEASVRVPCDVDDSYGFQFNAINGTNVYVIYAQTPKFSIAGDSCTDPVTTATSSTCAAATVTQTVTVRGNSSSAATGVLAAAAVTTTPAAALNASAAAVTSTFAGTCPSTIGWNGNYSHPVTLTSTPHAGRNVAVPTSTSLSAYASASASVSASAATFAPALTLTSVYTAAPTFAAGHYWNTTVVAPTASATALTGAERVKTGSCSKKRQARKRHSDGGRRSPFPRGN